jgi:Fur family ferric uptake transcriptional regulator
MTLDFSQLSRKDSQNGRKGSVDRYRTNYDIHLGYLNNMIRRTRQRAAIRDAFEAHSRPLSPEEVLEAAQSAVDGLGIATVYRTIKSLLEESWLAEVQLPGQPSRYEVAGKSHHHHFHCRKCGKVYELDGCNGHLDEGVPDGFRVTGHDVLVYGFCDFCRDPTTSE